MKSIVGVLATVFLVLAAPAAAKTSAEDRAAIAAYEARIVPLLNPTTPDPKASPQTLAARMVALKVPAVSIAFIEDGRVTWAKAYGVAEMARARAVTPDTLFQAASMSKAVAAATALRLVEQGRLDLDGDINDRITAWKVPPSPFTTERKVTLRGLLSHTAGMTVSGFPGYAEGKPVPTTVMVLNGQAPANTPAVRSFEAPGKYAYSGGGYTVAQLAVAEAALRPFGSLAEDLVLRPAGMRRSTFAQPLPLALRARAASGHTAKGVVPGGSNTYPEYAAAGLWTTPSDYGRFLIALQKSHDGRPGALLQQTSAKAMMSPVDANYGLGLGVGRWGGQTYIQHSGGNAGFRCFGMAFLGGARQGVVVMTNGDGGGQLSGEIVRAIAAAYGWGDQDPTTAGSPRRAALFPPAAK